ncbi:DMT family transporter [Tistrella bauzanensis]
MLIVCASLGLQQVALKATTGDVSPVLLIAMRSGIAAVLVGLYMLALRLRSGMRLRFDAGDGNWKPGLLVGFLFTLEYLLLGEALRLTSAAHAVVFLYTAPVFAALILHVMVPAERMSPRQWVGILMAFAGVVAAFLGQRTGSDRAVADMLAGDLLALFAGAAWGLTTVVVRGSRLSRVPATQTLLYQLAAACLLLLLAAVLLDQMTFRPTAMVLANLGFQSVVVSFLAFLIWFWLLRRYVASRLGVLSFMTPLFGVLFGVWLLDEPMEPGFVVGAMLVLAGMTVVSTTGRPGWTGLAIRAGRARRHRPRG